MINRINKLEAFLKECGFAAKIWKNRVYIGDLGRDINAFFIVDDADQLADPRENALAGSALRVFSDADNVTAKWKINRAKQVKHGIMIRCAEKIGVEVCANWEDVIL